jgi:hypothetical protein
MVSKIGQRKFLLKYGYFESELDRMSPSEAKRIIASIEKIEHPQGQKKVYSKKEINAIKKFVEWQVKQYKDLYHLYEEEIKKETDHDDYIWLLGKKAGIGEIRQSLKTAVEDFLENNEDGTRKDEI